MTAHMNIFNVSNWTVLVNVTASVKLSITLEGVAKVVPKVRVFSTGIVLEGVAKLGNALLELLHRTGGCHESRPEYARLQLLALESVTKVAPNIRPRDRSAGQKLTVTKVPAAVPSSVGQQINCHESPCCSPRDCSVGQQINCHESRIHFSGIALVPSVTVRETRL